MEPPVWGHWESTPVGETQESTEAEGRGGRPARITDPTFL